MKNFILKLLILAFIISSSICFGMACAKTHEHTYKDYWNFDEIYHYKKATCEHGEEIYDKAEHIFSGNSCTVCEYATESVGLSFELNEDKESYCFNGLGTCTDSHVVIPEFYNDKPVTAIGYVYMHDFKELKTITIPRNVSKMGYIFPAEQFNKLYYNGSVDEWVQISVEVPVLLSMTEELYIDNDLVESVNITTATKISNYAFYYYSKLTSVTIGKSVKSIGENSFSGCSELTDIKIGKAVDNIGSSAFFGCPKLQSIDVEDENTNYKSVNGSLYNKNGEELILYANGKKDNSFAIPSTVKKIREGAIAFSQNLVSIDIPKSVVEIGQAAFSCCSKLTKISVEKENANYASLDGVLYTKDGNILIAYPSARSSVNISNNAEVIGDYALYGMPNIVSVVIPDNINIIGDYAFYNCVNLASVTLGKNVETIGTMAFLNQRLVEIINKSSKITISKNGGIENGSIGEYALSISNCEPDYVSKVSVDNEGYITYTDNGEKLLLGYNGSSVNLQIPNGVTKIRENAFANTEDVESIKLPDSINSIEANAFANTKMFRNENNWKDGAFYIGNWLIAVKTNISGSFIVQEGTENIASYAFKDCNQLNSIFIPRQIKKIDERAFSGCSNLEKVIYDGTVNDWVKLEFVDSIANPLYFADSLYINGELLTNANITKSTKINDFAFYRYSKLTSVTLGADVGEIGEDAFAYCVNLVEVVNKSPNLTIEKGSYENGEIAVYAISVFNSKDNYIKVFNIDENGFMTYSDGVDNILVAYVGEGDKVVLPDNITNISSTAFRGCSHITEIIIGNSIKTIPYQLFAECIKLKFVTISKSVENIGNSAFYNCKELEKVYYTGTINDWVKIKFSNYASNPLYYAKELYINGSLMSIINVSEADTISSYSFYGYKGLISVAIGNNVESIGSYAFMYCDNLSSVSFSYPYGWKRYEDGSNNVLSLDVNNSAENAILLKEGIRFWRSR